MNCRAVAAALLVVALSAAPLHAYLKFGFRIGAETIDVKWPEAPIRYFVNERDIAGVVRDLRGRQLVTLKNHGEKLEVSRNYTHLFKQM